MNGKIRIIAGQWRGRKLQVPDKPGLRPTPNRVRETLFNWLMPYIHETNCLDCFAGAGSLGFEALSRGAKKVTLIELNKAAAKQLLANKQLIKSNDMVIANTDVLAFLKAPAADKFDLVLPEVMRENQIDILEKDSTCSGTFQIF